MTTSSTFVENGEEYVRVDPDELEPGDELDSRDEDAKQGLA